MRSEWFFIGLAAVITLEMLAHWFPVNLPQLLTYAVGSALVWVGFALWRIPIGDTETPLGLLILYVAAGIAVYLAYGVDWGLRWIRATLRKARLGEKALADDHIES